MPSTAPTFGLSEAFAAIDAQGWSHNDPTRYLLRAAAAYNYDDAMTWHREMQRALDAAAEARGLRRRDVDRLVMPPAAALTRRPPESPRGICSN